MSSETIEQFADYVISQACPVDHAPISVHHHEFTMKPRPIDTEPLSVGQIASLFNVKPRTVYLWVRKGKVFPTRIIKRPPGTRRLLFDREGVMDLLNGSGSPENPS